MRVRVTIVLVLLIVTIPAAAQISGDQWVPIGPAPIADYFDRSVGRATAIAVNPKNGDQVWVGTAAGGVWYSLNGGKNWTPESDLEDSLAIGAIALDECSVLGCPSIFVGTGENAIRRETYHGAGLLLGAVTGFQNVNVAWTQRTGSPGIVDFRFASIVDLVLDPETSGAAKRIWVALSSGETASSSGATVTAPSPLGGYGIYRSNNRGTTWSKVTVPGSGTSRPTDLELHPDKPAVLFAGFLGKGLFRSSDKGASWCPLNKGVVQNVPAGCPAPVLPHILNEPFDHVEVAIAPSNPQIVYATFGVCNDRLIQNCVPGVWRSSNGGNTWTKRTTAVPANQDATSTIAAVYSRYTHGLTVDPSNANRVFLGGVRLWRADDITAGASAAWVASDALENPGNDKVIHLDHHEIVFAPDKPGRVYDTSDGGFHISKDGGKTWAVGSDDLQITGFHGIATSPKTTNILGTAQDNGGMEWDGTNEWEHLSCCGDGGFSVMDWDDALTLYAGSNWGTVKRLTAGNFFWDNVSGPWFNSQAPRLFYAPLVQAPAPVNGNHTIYFGSNQLWRNTRKHTDPAAVVATQWVAVSPILAAGSFPEIVTTDNDAMQAANPNGGLNVITTIAVAPSNLDRIYIGYYGGQIFRTNGPPCFQAACWPATDPATPDVPVTRIAVHPANPDVAYATFSGFGTYARVWKTTDAGKTWKPRATGLPDNIPANVIAIEHKVPERVYVGMDSGPNGVSLFRSTDGGASWQPFGKGLPNAPVYDLAIDHLRDRIVAGTHGRGAFMIGKAFLKVMEDWSDALPALPFYGYSFPANQSCTVTVMQGDGAPCASGSVDAMGGTIRTDALGRLETTKEGSWEGRAAAWACLNGQCLGDRAGQCGSVSRIAVTCGTETVTAALAGRPSLVDPPSTWLELDTGAAGTPGPASGTLELTATVQRRAGTESLCTVSVPYAVGQPAVDVLARLEAAINASAVCTEKHVRAVLDRGEPGPSEDEFARPPRLSLDAPSVEGSALATAVRFAPAASARSCIFLGGLGTSTLDQLHATKIDVLTPTGGAAGSGTITLAERTPLGTCRIDLPTTAGQTGPQLSAALAAASQAPGIPGPHPACSANHNARDLTVRDGSLVSIFAKSLQLCSSDANVGFALRSNGTQP